jgi:MFS transporter, putative metabolite:H+ symporter
MTDAAPATTTTTTTIPTSAWRLVIVAALGYFVDIYDLLLFGIVRITSLTELGLQGDALLQAGVWLLDAQMIGLLIGGFLWGVLADKFGRLQVLFGSILLYSLANLANAFVDTTAVYAACRFVAGIGLAGELGAGVTLVSELLPKHNRGVATTLIAGVGIGGAVAAALVADLTTWRNSYILGGVLGLLLLLLRVGALDSPMFDRARAQHAVRGSLRMFVSSRARLWRMCWLVLVATPIWYVVALLVTLAPELGRAMGLTSPPTTGTVIVWAYTGLFIGDLSSGLLSQHWRSRKRALAVFVVGTAVMCAVFFVVGGISARWYCVACCGAGACAGYWAVFITSTAEQFGTNVRATATTAAPNLVRAMVVPMTWMLTQLKGPLGVVQATQVVGVIVFTGAFVALRQLQETFGKDLDYSET